MVEENHRCGSNLLLTSTGSSIKINSISIDLLGVDDEIHTGKCEHFSIRSYVSEIRKIDLKKCWPFALSVNQHNSEEQAHKLPPLSVPKFRWWRCESCLREIKADSIINENDVQLASSSNPTVVAMESNYHISTCDNKDKDAEPTTLIVEDTNQAVTSLIDAASEASPTLDGQHTNEIAVLETDCIKSTEPCMVRNKSQETACLELASKSSDCVVSSPMKNNEKENKVFVSGINSKNMIAPQSAEMAGVVDEALVLVKSPSPGWDDWDNVSSESAILARKSLQRHHDDNAAGLHHRKTRKVRLLSELLGKDGDTNTVSRSSKDSPSNSVAGVLEGLHTPASKGENFMRGKIKRELVQNKKRKSQEDEEWKPPEMNPQNNYVKRKFRATTTSSEISGPDSEDSEEDLRNHLKNQKSNMEIGRNCIKKKRKKAQAVDERVSLSPKEKLLKDTRNSVKDSGNSTGADNAFPSSTNSAFKRKLVPCPLHAQKTEAKAILSKKKNKTHLMDGYKKSPASRNSGMPEEKFTTGREAEVSQSQSVTIPLQSTQDTFAEKGLGLSLNSFLVSSRYNENLIPQFEDRPALSWPWQEGTSREVYSRLKDLCFHAESETQAYVPRGVHLDFSNRGTGKSMQFQDEKQKYSPVTQAGNPSFMKRLDTSGAHSKGKTIFIHEQSGTAENMIKQRVEKEPEPAILDDVPMEIVELMAKNQYERCLPDTEENKQKSQDTESTKKLQLIDLNKAYENGSSNASQDEATHEPKPHWKKNRKNQDFTRAEPISAPMQQSVDFSSHAERDSSNISQFGQPYIPSGYWAFPQNRKTPESMPFSAINSSRQSTAPNCQFVGNMPGQNCGSSSFRLLRPCNTCQNVPQQLKEPAHVWPSSILNHMPFGYNMPQKHVEQTQTMNHIPKGSITGEKDLNFWNVNALEEEKQKRAQREYSYGCKHSGMRSLDPYSNDSIPAMHLLSLMDAGLRSNSSTDLKRNPKFLERPSLSQGFSREDFAGQHRNLNTMRHSSSDCLSKNILPEALCETFTGAPRGSTLGFSLQHHRNFRRPIGLTAESSLKNQNKGKTKVFPSPVDKRSYNTQTPVFTSGNFGKMIGSVPAPSVPKLFLGASDSSKPLLKCPATTTKQKSKVQSHNDIVPPPKTSLGPMVCGLNRNPADFSIPEPGNVYMLKGEDIKFRKRACYGKKIGADKPDAMKRKKKLSSEKGLAYCRNLKTLRR